MSGEGDPGFRIVASTPSARLGFLEVTEETVEGPDGARHPRTVVHHPGAVVVVPIVDGTHAVLVRQFRAAVGGSLLEVPAGKRDVHGEPPEVTAARELLEETGLRSERIVPLAEFYNTPGFCDEYTHLFAAFDLVDGGGRQPVGAEEAAMTIEHVPLDAVDAMIADRRIVDAKTIIGLLLARDHLAAHGGPAG